jgi:hypothetical protein
MELTQQQVYDICPREVVPIERDDEDVASVWFADRRGSEVRYVSVARSLPDGPVHTERDDQKWGCYGGLTRVELVGGMLSLHFDSAAAGKLGGIELMRVDCRGMTEQTRERIESVLRAMFAGSSIPMTIS